MKEVDLTHAHGPHIKEEDAGIEDDEWVFCGICGDDQGTVLAERADCHTM